MKNSIFALALLAFIACSSDDFTPKPFGNVRIELPERSYKSFNDTFPYRFEFPAYGEMKKRRDYWSTVQLKNFKSDIHLTYKPLNNNLYKYLEESRELVYNHTSKADGIQERVYENSEAQTWGVLYEISGDAASQLQFVITDSTDHFLRGALYFRATPNYDSIRPVFEFLREDVIHLMETTRWNEPS
ncbi:MAG: gliding motility lipoprotein GldD [Flavobacteriales bacterium]|nr:gliding motility lipoprotein GldD [Flavobacteriales bacterium]